MLTSLHIRSYPAPGANIVPQKFRPGANGYFLCCLLPAAFLGWFVAALLNAHHRDAVWYGALISFAALVAVIGLLTRLKAEIVMEGVAYTNIFGTKRFIAFPEISSVALIDYRHLRSEATFRRSIRSSTLVISPKIVISQSALKIPLTLFPDSVRIEFQRLLQPEEIESD